MQQLCVIRGKLLFLSCMVSGVRLVKRSLQKSGYKTRVQSYSRTKKELTKKPRASYKHLTRQTKKELTISQLYNSTKKGAQSSFCVYVVRTRRSAFNYLQEVVMLARQSEQLYRS